MNRLFSELRLIFIGSIRRHKTRTEGIGLVEIVAGLAIAGLFMAGMLQTIAEGRRNADARAVADRMIEVEDAARKYLIANYAALLPLAEPSDVLVIPIGRESPTAAIPSGPSGLDSVQGGGFLPSSYVDRNIFNQRHALLVREPEPNVLEAIVTTFDGTRIPDNVLAKVPRMIGSSGGAILNNPPGSLTTDDIVGTGGGWRADRNDWSAAASTPAPGFAMANIGMDPSAVLSPYLYRDDIGVPEANQMNTAIDMNGNDIENANLVEAIRVEADTARLNEGLEVCANGTLGCGITVSSVGGLFDFNDGFLTLQGNTPGGGVNIAGAGNNLNIGGITDSQGRIFARDGLHVTGDNVRIDGTGAVLWETYGGGFRMTNSSFIETVNNAGLDTGSGEIRNTSRVVTGEMVDADDSTYYVDPNGTVRIRDLVSDTINVDATITGTSRGSTAHRVGDLLPRYVAQYAYLVSNNVLVPKPTCGATGEEKIIITPAFAADRLDLGLNPSGGPEYTENVSWYIFRATDAGTAWLAVIDVGSEEFPSPGSALGIAQTFCYYP